MIRTEADLPTEPEMPEVLRRLCAHTSAYEVTAALGCR